MKMNNPKKVPKAAYLVKLSTTELTWSETLARLHHGLGDVISQMTSIVSLGKTRSKMEESTMREIAKRGSHFRKPP